MELLTFLQTVITTEKGYLVLAYANQDKEDWTEEFFYWPTDADKYIKRVSTLVDGHNVYFSPYLFREPKSTKANVLPSRTIAADLDEANLLTVPIKASILVETSPERHQGYWILKEYAETLDAHESASKQLTYAIPRCDHSGWWLGKKLRVPSTYNYKYVDGAKLVTIVDVPHTIYNIEHFESLPQVGIAESIKDTDDIDTWIEAAESQEIGPYELLERYRTKLPPKVIAYYDRSASDRSEALWALTTSLFRAGATKEDAYLIAKASANNKFAELKYGGRRELGKDVLRAQGSVNSATPNLRDKILQARKLPGIAPEKRAYIADVIKQHMSSIGKFVHCNDGSHWFIRDDTGKPIQIQQRSEQVQILLDTMYGLNATEPESSYVINSLIAYVSSMMPAGNVASLTYYDVDTKSLFLHTGRKDVLRITAAGIDNVTDGYQGVVFPWNNSSEAISPRYMRLDQPWYEELFGDCLGNLVGMDRAEAMALLRTWIIMLLLRNSVVSRPILAIFGQPGAGKSTLFRRVYALLYGRHKSLGAVSTAEDFDFACATDPLVVLDNVDTWEKWLPDRLALAAAASDLQRRKLYTNGEVVTIKRQALLGITAHNPQFGREDVNDRLILLTFERLEKFTPETDILQRITHLRSALWGAIVEDVQRVLASPMPNHDEVPQFRVEDFARSGYWIARAVNNGEEFRRAIASLREVQKSFSLEEDHLLMTSIQAWMKTSSTLNEYRTPGQLWPLLESRSGNDQAFKQKYRNAVNLGKKLWSLMDSLKQLYDIEWKFDAGRGSRAWRILPKGDAQPRVVDIKTA